MSLVFKVALVQRYVWIVFTHILLIITVCMLYYCLTRLIQATFDTFKVQCSNITVMDIIMSLNVIKSYFSL